MFGATQDAVGIFARPKQLSVQWIVQEPCSQHSVQLEERRTFRARKMKTCKACERKLSQPCWIHASLRVDKFTEWLITKGYMHDRARVSAVVLAM